MAFYIIADGHLIDADKPNQNHWIDYQRRTGPILPQNREQEMTIIRFSDLKVGDKFKLYYSVDPVLLIKISKSFADYAKDFDQETKDVLGRPNMNKNPRIKIVRASSQ